MDPTWCEVSRDGTILFSRETPWDGPPRMTGTVYVHCGDVDLVLEQISEAIEVPWGVEEREWGARELVLVDPNGYYLTFTSE